ncbi:tRNA (adenine(22)-N(1))-methyltransferase [Cohnella thailandensis]|uniref:SAM-dependent methyltransferase n=1 Tax=Cohnella thailandensis TaxID=557557 RepID=A0A841T048_9BACL|nr:class I SAM-dependent methyltransferase [Cohnella thailandensis]MBB6636246.1 SAM-dependent methyltransferase [Cohnella thailandensis]MBP1973785.1 tRNA (adenine22-N1)-methyltransferase [Cohnella thailandensis]
MTDTKANAANMKISRRLSALAEWVPEGARFADIGTDHALLPVYLASSGRIRLAVAGDVHKGPVEAARRQVASAGLADIISVRHGDGLSVLRQGEADTVCIAGMGGSLMVRLLEEAGPLLDSVTTLVLSPHVAEEQVRRWLNHNGFVLARERILFEDGEYYTLLKAERDESGRARERIAELYSPALLAPCCAVVPEELLLAMGPLLLRSPSEEFRGKWERELAKREMILGQLRKSSQPESAEKAKEWESFNHRLKEVLACLPGEKR